MGRVLDVRYDLSVTKAKGSVTYPTEPSSIQDGEGGKVEWGGGKGSVTYPTEPTSIQDGEITTLLWHSFPVRETGVWFKHPFPTLQPS